MGNISQVFHSFVDDHWVVSKFELLRVKLLGVFSYLSFVGHKHSFFLSISLGVGLLDHRIDVCLHW